MPSTAKRIQTAPAFTRGTRRRTRSILPRYRDDDLRLFRHMSRLSRRAIANYVDRLLRPR